MTHLNSPRLTSAGCVLSRSRAGSPPAAHQRAMLSGGGNFFLSDEQLRASPSRADAIDEECEFKLRVYGAELVQEGCILLNLCVAVRTS